MFNSGILAGGSTYDYRPASPEIVSRVEQLAKVCTSYDVPLKAAAMRFPTTHPAVTTVLIGCATAAEVRENVEALAAAPARRAVDGSRLLAPKPPRKVAPPCLYVDGPCPYS